MFKKFLFAICLILISLAAPQARAAAASATPVQVNLNCCNVVNYQYFEAVTSLTKAIKGVMVASGATTPIKLAIGASGSESDQIIIPASNSAAIFYPLVVSAGQRVSLKSYGSTGGGPSNGASGRELDMSFFYN